MFYESKANESNVKYLSKALIKRVHLVHFNIIFRNSRTTVYVSRSLIRNSVCECMQVKGRV